MYYENKVTKVLFWLPRIAILLYALYPSIEDNEAFALPFYCTILVLYRVWLLYDKDSQESVVFFVE